MAFDKITLQPKVVAAIIPVNIELLEGTANAASIIESKFTIPARSQTESNHFVWGGVRVRNQREFAITPMQIPPPARERLPAIRI
ncbi:MAG TPA: hypothetical protein DCE55_11000 [Planctomycetaceae bacterium]|nr:hypothetical protein [Planctomycetaceae bacterium]